MDAAVVESRTIGEAWFEVSRAILDSGVAATWGPLSTIELQRVTLVVARPDPADSLIGELGDPEWLAWMAANFRDDADVAELDGAKSYAVRLFDYDGRDQIAWVVERLRADPTARDATITTFMPSTDTSYVPCVSLLDFWLPDGAVELLVYAHSLDFGKKAYGNLVELARLQHRVAGELAAPAGRLVVHVKSAHVYESERALMERLLTAEGVARTAVPVRPTCRFRNRSPTKGQSLDTAVGAMSQCAESVPFRPHAVLQLGRRVPSGQWHGNRDRCFRTASTTLGRAGSTGAPSSSARTTGSPSSACSPLSWRTTAGTCTRCA
jgi:Thymidylate synthase